MTVYRTMILEEISHLLELSLSPQDALAHYWGPDALNDRIQEWFETPEGTVADFPSWGNNLEPFKHEPLSVHLAVVMEAKIIPKLSQDCGLPVSGIRVDFLDIDRCRIQIQYSGGLFDSEVKRSAF